MKCFARAAAFTACVTLACAAAGEGLSFAALPANTKWVLHLDAKTLLASPLGQEILASLPGTPGEAKLMAFEALTSIDVRHDLLAVTVCGAGDASRGGVAYLRGHWNLPKLSTIAAGADQYAEKMHNRHTIMSWNEQKTDQPKRQYACLVSTNLVLFSDHEANLDVALDVLDGQSARLSDSPRLKLFDQPAGHPFLWLAAVDVKDLVANNPQAAVLQQANSISVLATADAQGVQVAGTLKADNAEAAQQVQQVLQGFQSLALLQGGKNPDFATIAQTTAITVEGQAVHVAMTVPLDLVRRLMARKHGAGARATPPAPAGQDPF